MVPPEETLTSVNNLGSLRKARLPLLLPLPRPPRLGLRLPARLLIEFAQERVSGLLGGRLFPRPSSSGILRRPFLQHRAKEGSRTTGVGMVDS